LCAGRADLRRWSEGADFIFKLSCVAKAGPVKFQDYPSEATEAHPAAQFPCFLSGFNASGRDTKPPPRHSFQAVLVQSNLVPGYGLVDHAKSKTPPS